MKKLVASVSVIICLLLLFSSFSVFAADVGVIGSADGETGIIVDEYGEIDEEALEEYLMNSDFMEYAVVLGFGIIFSVLAFIPALIVMIVFIVKNSKTKKELRQYQAIYGPLVNVGIQYNGYQVNNPVNAPVNTQNVNNGYNNNYPNGFNNNQGGQM